MLSRSTIAGKYCATSAVTVERIDAPPFVTWLRTVSWTSVGSEVRASCSTTLSRKSALVLNLRKNVAVDESDAWTTSSMRIPRSRIRRGSATNSVTAASTKWVAVASSSFMGTDFTEVRPTVTVPVTVLTLG
jgi:hypothetical protein